MRVGAIQSFPKRGRAWTRDAQGMAAVPWFRARRLREADEVLESAAWAFLATL